MMRSPIAIWALLALGCSSAERPPALTALESVRESPSVIECRRSAPQAHAEAERFAEQAMASWQSGDREAAEHWGNMATAAYEHAIALARRARAEKAAAEASRHTDDLHRTLSDLESEQAKLDAETGSLELQAKVIQDAQPLVPVDAANPERTRARRAAARAWLTEAKLLCVAETLVTGERSDATNELIESISQALDGIAQAEGARLVEEARRLRSACLERLTVARRPATRKAPSAAQADELLSRLSEVAALHPFRDDRGVVVILGAPATSAGLSPATQAKLDAIAKVVAASPACSLLVVSHAPEGPDAAKSNAALVDAAVRILDPGGTRRIVREFVGQAHPLVDPAHPGAKEQNSRLEIVFVTHTNL